MNKMSRILQYTGDKNTDISLLNETWQLSSVPGKYDSFSASIKDAASTEMMNLNCFSCPRPSGGRGGGVETLTLSKLSAKRFTFQHVYTSFEYIFISIKLGWFFYQIEHKIIKLLKKLSSSVSWFKTGVGRQLVLAGRSFSFSEIKKSFGFSYTRKSFTFIDFIILNDFCLHLECLFLL